jgi:formyl-CoA transferase
MTASRDVPVDSAASSLLRGVRVVDFSQALAGPYCTLILADLGADVIKIESPHRGDDARHWGPPFLGEDAAYFISVNRNKRSVALDLKSRDGLDAALAVITGADVLVENWRPGTAARLGLDASVLRERYPRLIYCSISGFGQDLPPRSGYDQIVQGMSGVMEMTGPEGSPTKFGVPIGDIAAGMFAATAISAALFDRVRTGRGRTFDIAMRDSLVAMLTHQATRYLATGQVPPNDYNRHSTIAPYGLFVTADGHVNVCVGNDAQFLRFCRALGFDDVAADDRFATNRLRVRQRRELYALLEPRLKAFTTGEVVRRLEDAGVPVGPVYRMDEVFADPQIRARGMLMNLERPDFGSCAVPAGPWHVDGETASVRLPPPRLGEHTAEVLGAAGVDREHITRAITALEAGRRPDSPSNRAANEAAW